MVLRQRGLLVSLAVAGLIAGTPGFAASTAESPVYKDPDAAIAARVDDLLQRMTLEDKVIQLLAVWEDKAEILDDSLELDPVKLRQRYPDGIGQFSRPSDSRGPISPRVEPRRDARETVELVNALQKFAVEETRLGIPMFFHEEGLHGYAARGATSFPQAIGLASSWDRSLVREVNSITAREIRARGVHLVLSPVVDIARDPRWGRIEETFGEDPFLVSEMGIASVRGLQGELIDGQLPPEKVFATLKHMTGHGQPESGTNIGPAPISERELRENFFPPFEAAIRDAGVRLVMASYNEIDGVPSHVNNWLLRDVLRGEWAFDGVVVADYYAIDQLVGLHHVAADMREAAVRVLIWGAPGAGLTHLLQAVCHDVHTRQKTVQYLPLRDMVGFSAFDLCEGLEEFAYVCLDDIDHVCGIREWEQALFHLYNKLRDAGHALLIASHTSPPALPVVLADLKSRLLGSVRYHVKSLSDDGKQNALMMRARARGMEMPVDVAQFILNRASRDTTELFDLLDRLDDESMQRKRKLTIPFVKEVFRL